MFTTECLKSLQQFSGGDAMRAWGKRRKSLGSHEKFDEFNPLRDEF